MSCVSLTCNCNQRAEYTVDDRSNIIARSVQPDTKAYTIGEYGRVAVNWKSYDDRLLVRINTL